MSEISCVCDQTSRQGNPQPVAMISRNSRRFGQEKKKTGSEGSREARALDYEVSLVSVWRITPHTPLCQRRPRGYGISFRVPRWRVEETCAALLGADRCNL